MTLVDTSVWVNHLRASDPNLIALLNDNQVLIHPMVIGEPACGNLRNREQILSTFEHLPRISVADDEEALFFIERHRLMGRGIGYVDAHLLASVALTAGARMWTLDRRLRVIAAEMDLVH